MDTPIPIAVFRAYPVKGSSLYFEVHVFKTKRQLRDFGRVNRVRGMEGVAGYCQTFLQYLEGSDGIRRLTSCIGHIVLCKCRLSARVVSHECVHAMFGYFQRKRRSVPCRLQREFGKHGAVTDKEEQACHIVSDLTNRIYTVLYDRRVIK